MTHWGWYEVFSSQKVQVQVKSHVTGIKVQLEVFLDIIKPHLKSSQLWLESKPYDSSPHLWFIHLDESAQSSYSSKSFAGLMSQCKVLYATFRNSLLLMTLMVVNRTAVSFL